MKYIAIALGDLTHERQGRHNLTEISSSGIDFFSIKKEAISYYIIATCSIDSY